MLRRIAALALAGAFMSGVLAQIPEGVDDPYPKVAAAYVVALDGQPLWFRGVDAARQPASLAKLLTALVLLREGWSPEARVRVSARAAAVGGSRLGLRAGEALSAGDALVAMLVRSANDACVALAEHAAGSLEAFAARMNALGTRLGLQESHFVHPCGLDAKGQRSSARDLLRIAVAAWRIEEVRRIAALPQAVIRTLGGRRLAMQNTNALIGRFDGAIGLKSGYTRGAGKCLVAVAERGGHQAWLVLLDAPDRWWTAVGMLADAFASLAPGPGAAPR